MMSVIHIATSTIATKGLNNTTENFKGSLEQDIILSTTINYNTLVATTPKIITRQSKVLNRYVNIIYLIKIYVLPSTYVYKYHISKFLLS